MYTSANNVMQLGSHRLVKSSLIKLYLSVIVEFINCSFKAYSDYDIQVTQVQGSSTNPTIVVIKNTTFSYYTNNTFLNFSHDDALDLSFIYLSNSTLVLEDFVVFNSIASPHSVISLQGNSTIIISGSIELSHNHAHDLINFYDNERKYIIMKEYSIMNITNNDVQSLFTTSPTVAKYPNAYCLFQYFSNNTNKVAMKKGIF